MVSFPYDGARRKLLLQVAILIAAIALTDWRVNAEVPIGFLYLLPMVLASRVLNRGQIALLGAACTILAEAFDSIPWSPLSGVPRVLLPPPPFPGLVFFRQGVVPGRRAAVTHVEELERENQARRDAEE